MMKKRIAGILCLLTFLAVFTACNSDGLGASTEVRETKWNMSKEEVYRLENNKLMGQDENYLFYYDTDQKQPMVFMGANTNNNVDLRYYFTNDKLIKIEYKLNSTKIKDLYYEMLKGDLNDLYGEPYRSDVAGEDGTMQSSWKKGGTDITLTYEKRESASGSTLLITYKPNN